MNIEMELQVKFNHEVNLKKDYIYPGGFQFLMNGKSYHFDFSSSDRTVSSSEPTVCVFVFQNIDYEEFPETKNISVDDLKNISSIEELFIYLGDEEKTDLEVEKIQNIIFFTPSVEPYVYHVPENLIDEYNKNLQNEKIKKQMKYDIKLTPSELKEKIMAQQLSFYSKFLDIPLEDICGYTKEQLESMINSTIKQMPDELLHQFEIELMGGKREF